MRGAYTWSLPQILELVDAGKARLIDVDGCPYVWRRLSEEEKCRCCTREGAEEVGLFLKRFRFLVVRAPWLEAAALRCGGEMGHFHASLEGGSRAAASAEFSPELSHALASALAVSNMASSAFSCASSSSS